MPVHTVTLPNGGVGFQWGSHGAKYRDRESAERQARAAKANGADSRVARDSNIRQLVKNLLQFFAEEADEPEHDDAEDEERTRAAGVAVQAPDGSMLMVRRKGADHEGEWAFPGGVAEGEETPEETARRELAEETGHEASSLEPAFSSHVGDVDFATYLHQVDERFEPKLTDEASEHGWFTRDALPEPLHPGVMLAFGRGDAWEESKHPRDNEGKFGTGGGGGGGGSPLDPGQLKKVGGQKGSNPGGVYQDAEGKAYYIKKGRSEAHVRNELLAAKLYGLAGAPTMDYRSVKGGDRIATEMRPLAKNNANKFSPDEIKAARKDFATHAWLANWDAVGLGGDNLVMAGGKPVALDLGGALEYRAQGAPKGGKFGTSVGELKTMRDPNMNPDAARVFGKLTPEEFKASAAKVTSIPDEAIEKAVSEMGGPKELAAKLIARRDDIAKQADGAHDTMATDPPVSEAQRRAMFAAASGHSKLGISREVGKEFVGEASDAMPFAFDRASVRTYDADGRLHVKLTNISKAAINPYRGREIPTCKKDHAHDASCAVNLEPDRVYNLLRHPDELAKAARTFNNLPLLSDHQPTSADKHPDHLVIGSTGTDATFAHPYLKNSLVVWPRDAIEDIERADDSNEKDVGKRELSCGYRYRADMTPGTYDGQPYDGIMRDIVGNHVALVKQGRAGADVVVGDSALDASTTDLNYTEIEMRAPKTRLGLYIHGGLSTLVRKPWKQGGKEIALALDAALSGATSETFTDKAKREALKASVAAIPKIAQDADLEGMHKFIDRLDNPEALPEHADANLEEDPNKKASDEEEDEEKKKADDAKFHASDRYKAARDEWEKEDKEKEKGKAEDEPPDFAGKPKVGKGPEGVDKKAMDAAIDAAVTKVRTNERAIREAERFVRPWVGELSMAFDSAEEVHRKALDLLNVKHAGKHADALTTMIEAQPKPGAKPRREPPSADRLAADQAGVKSFAERYPGAANIRVMS